MKPQAELAFDFLITGVTITCMDYKADKSVMRSVPYVLQQSVVLDSSITTKRITTDFLYGVVPGLLDFVTRGFDGSDLVAIIPMVQLSPRLEHFSSRSLPTSITSGLERHLADNSYKGWAT